MEILLYLLAACLTLFGVLGIIDGFYLHIWRYRLYEHAESRFEHLTHTARTILFPGIVCGLFLFPNVPGLYQAGLLLVLADIAVLAVDAYSEKDSRAFMGGLPRWEYILHLFVNGFHFGSILLFIGLKFSVEPDGLVAREIDFSSPAGQLVHWLAVNILPGAVLMAVLHIWVSLPGGRVWWHTKRNQITCC
ncbi:MAG: hypothetical protein JNM22_06315 [Saprospiraceae bacterium]|jgi:hypothetical protein|nr:hypothetical protein [Saprospiraceae bacterium]